MKLKEAEERLVEVLRRRHLAWSTEQSYVGWLRRFFAFLLKSRIEGASERKLEAFLSALARDEVAASTQNQAFNALLFFYQECLGQKLEGVRALRAKRGAFVRRAPAVDEVRRLLAEVRDEGQYPVRLVVRWLYGCGLRVSEPVGIRVRDLNLPESSVVIRQAKGGKDRVVAIPCSLMPEVLAQVEFARGVWQRDVAAGVPVKLPGRMERKYRNAEWSWSWAWLFPQAGPCADPRSGRRVRWHMLESVVQRAVRGACRRAGVEVLPHELRHGFATHCLNRGVNPRAIQLAMGHVNLETTMGYLHAEALSVPSPLEVVG